MKKFDFSLEKVLNLREFEEDQAKIELAKAIAESERLQNILKNLAEERVKNNEKRRFSSDVFYLQNVENYIKAIDAKKEETLELLANNELVIEEKRLIVTEAMQKRKALTKLKEKKYSKYKKDLQKEEDKILDEIKNKGRFQTKN